MTKIEWRVTCTGLNPKYYQGPTGRYEAHKYATGRPHLKPTTWWRHQYDNGGSSPWYDLTHTDPNHVSEAS